MGTAAECNVNARRLCSGNGVCRFDTDANAPRCFCNTGYAGNDCSRGVLTVRARTTPPLIDRLRRLRAVQMAATTSRTGAWWPRSSLPSSCWWPRCPECGLRAAFASPPPAPSCRALCRYMVWRKVQSLRLDPSAYTALADTAAVESAP